VDDDGTPVASVDDPGLTNRLTTRLAGLAVGAHPLTVAAVSDTEEEGAASGSVSVTIPAELLPPTALAYLSGNAAACVVRFRASQTAPGLLHNAYARNCDEEAVNTLAVVATATSTDDGAWAASTAYTVGQFRRPVAWNGLRYEVTGTTGDGKSGATPPVFPTTEGATVVDNHVTWTCRGYTVTLPAITGYVGTAEMRLLAVNAGVEDGYATALFLEFDVAGAFVPPRPNDPATEVQNVDGRELTVRYHYDSSDEGAAPDTVELFLIAEGGSVNWSSPDASQAIVAEDGSGQRVGTIAATAGADGFFRWAVRVSASGTRNESTTLSGPDLLSTQTQTPTGLTARLAP
jgi:hypothetical protein